jgi:F5/8 type C domain
MSKKVRQQQKTNKPEPKSRRYRKATVVIGLIFCLGVTVIILAQLRANRAVARTNAMLSQPAPTPSNFSPSNPSKEYIYAGGRLVATEEPAATQTPPAPPALVNLALNKTATQKSTYGSQVASRAIDGNTLGNSWNLYTLTGYELQPWWQVDLGLSTNIQTIKVWPRTDCCPDQITWVYVFVSDQPFNANDTPQACIDRGMWNYYSATTMLTPTSIPVNQTGRYVRVWTKFTNHLSLAEVEVLGPAPPTNLALNKTATQSSTYGSQSASRAVDGNPGGTWNDITLTGYEAQAWWQVDLGSVRSLQTIKLRPRSDLTCCLDNFYVFVSDVPFTSNNVTATQNQAGVWNSYVQSGFSSIPTSVTVNRTGRYVRVQQVNTNHLSLSEVEVLGN